MSSWCINKQQVPVQGIISLSAFPAVNHLTTCVWHTETALWSQDGKVFSRQLSIAETSLFRLKVWVSLFFPCIFFVRWMCEERARAHYQSLASIIPVWCSSLCLAVTSEKELKDALWKKFNLPNLLVKCLPNCLLMITKVCFYLYLNVAWKYETLYHYKKYKHTGCLQLHLTLLSVSYCYHLSESQLHYFVLLRLKPCKRPILFPYPSINPHRLFCRKLRQNRTRSLFTCGLFLLPRANFLTLHTER